MVFILNGTNKSWKENIHVSLKAHLAYPKIFTCCIIIFLKFINWYFTKSVNMQSCSCQDCKKNDFDNSSYLCQKFDWFRQSRILSLLINMFKAHKEWLGCTGTDCRSTPLFQGQHVHIIWQRALQSWPLKWPVYNSYCKFITPL